MIQLHQSMSLEVLTMTIQVRFFASLRETMGDDKSIDKEQVNTVEDIWKLFSNNQDMPANVLMSINMDYVDAQSPVNDGDEVAFFPPVTGG